MTDGSARSAGALSAPRSRSPAVSRKTSETEHRRPGWRSADIVRAVALGVVVVAAAIGLWNASTVVFTVFLGILFGLAISSGVDYLTRLHIPRGLGAPIVVLAVAGVLALIGASIAPTINDQLREIQSRLPDALRRAEAWVSQEERTTIRTITGHIPFISRGGPPASDTTLAAQGPSAAGGGSTSQNVASQVTSGLAGVAGHLFGVVGSTVELVVYLLLILFIAVYIASDPGVYHRGLMHLFPHHARARAGEVLSHIASVLRLWLLTQLIAMITLGVVWAVVLSILGVRAALALAVIAGLLEFVPTIGPTMAVVPALAMGLLDSPGKAVSVLVAYLIIQGFESNLLIPLLMQDRIDLPPALTIIAQALMTLFFGFLGLMVAVPLLAAAMVPVKILYVEDVVGDQVMEDETVGATASVVDKGEGGEQRRGGGHEKGEPTA
jgi:predicted PurR-regulated permease PerM